MHGESLSILLALTIGFTHAFEADHLVAVSSLVTKRRNSWLAIKDGIFWGLGHTSTILFIGMLMILGRYMIAESTFSYLEAIVGVMLIGIGLWRLYQAVVRKDYHFHHHEDEKHHLAYGVGLVHGLAGSGTMVLYVLANMKSAREGLLYLLVFGVGSVAGMLVASGLFSLPFSKKITSNTTLHLVLTIISAAICIVLGGNIINENLL